MSKLVERLRTASSNVAYARQEGTTGFLAGWEHLVMRQSADRIAELEARVKVLELELEAAQCLMDSQYKAGVKLGWNLCAENDEAGYQCVMASTEHIAELKRIQAERAALNPSARSE